LVFSCPHFLSFPRFIAKSESVNFAAGEVVLDKGQQIKCIYLIKSGSVRKVLCILFSFFFFFFFFASHDLQDVSGVGSRRLIQGDLFGERSLVGRSKSEARFVAEEDSVLLLTSHSHLAAGLSALPVVRYSFSFSIFSLGNGSSNEHGVLGSCCLVVFSRAAWAKFSELERWQKELF
jgi:CRP-like cAMP-binding protein